MVCFLGSSNLVVLSWNLLGTLLWPPCPSWEHLVHFHDVWFFGQNVKFLWYFLLENVQSWTVRVWKLSLMFSTSNLAVLSWNLLWTLLWPPCPSWEHFVHFLGVWYFGQTVRFFVIFLIENVQSWTVGSKSKIVFSPSNLVVLSWNLLGTLLWPPCPSWEHLVHFREVFIAKRSELDGYGPQATCCVFSLQFCCIELKSSGDTPVTPLPLMGTFCAFSWTFDILAKLWDFLWYF